MSHIITCPNCSTQVRVPDRNTDKTFICPRCLADVDSTWPVGPIRATSINTDVKRDVSVGSIVLAVLIILCVLGVVLVLAIASPKSSGYGSPREFWLMFPFAALDVLVSIAIIRGLLRRGIFDTRNSGFGTALGIMFLSLGTIGAVFIFFFFTCLVLINLHRP